MTGSRIGSPIAVVGFGLLMLKRIAVEQRALTPQSRPSQSRT
jgi:hypothetical protein